MRQDRSTRIEQVRIEDVNILNPRVRNQKKFMDMTGNIANVGLKRPITITPSKPKVSHGKPYELVCGQGRIEAFLACGQKTIPAIIINATEEQALIMSLVENLARRQHRSLELLHGIEVLRRQGYDAKVIAQKTGLSLEYSHSVITLLEKGEERLLTAVEAGQIPVSVAVKIAEAGDDEQAALQEAYESKELRGRKLMIAKRLLETRKRHGKAMKYGGRSTRSGKSNLSGSDVMKIYQKEVDRKRLLTRKADITSGRLLFITEALRQLLKEDHFVTLLKAEKLSTMPKQLSHLLDSCR